MMRFFSKMSLRKRMIAASVLWVVIGSLLGYALLSSVFHSHVSKQFYDEVIQHVYELENITAVDENGQLSLASEFSDAKYNIPNSGYYWEVRTANSILLSPSLNKHHLQMADEPFDREVAIHHHKISGPTGPLLVVEKSTHISPLNNIPKRLIVAVDRKHLDAMIGDFNSILAWAFVVLAAAMMLAAALLTSFALQPFKRLSDEFKNIWSGKAKKLEGQYPKEVTPLVHELNTLIQTSDDMLKRARAQAGNLAHGLKGSLAIITDEGYKLKNAGLEQSSKTIIKQCTIMERHIDHQIARTRASAAAHMPGIVSNLEDVLLPIVKAMEQLHRDKNINVHIDIRSHKPVTIDAIDLSEILGNILDNAFKVAASEIDIVARDFDDDQISLRVDDDGPGLPPEAYELVFDLGARWDETTAGGGLGLAIVRELVHLYGGNCRLDKSPKNGLRIEIFLPALHS